MPVQFDLYLSWRCSKLPILAEAPVGDGGSSRGVEEQVVPRRGTVAMPLLCQASSMQLVQACDSLLALQALFCPFNSHRVTVAGHSWASLGSESSDAIYSDADRICWGIVAAKLQQPKLFQ